MSSKDFINIKIEKSGLFGYKVEDVDSYVAHVHEYFEELIDENKELEKKVKVLAEKIKEYRNEEENIRDALLGAQKLANHVVTEAKEKANNLIEDAKNRVNSKVKYAQLDAEKKLKETKFNLDKEQKLLLKMQKEVSAFKSRLVSLYKTHLDLITSLPEVDKNLDNQQDLNEYPLDMDHIENEDGYDDMDKTKVIDEFDKIRS